jgi:hypothetical protein
MIPIHPRSLGTRIRLGTRDGRKPRPRLDRDTGTVANMPYQLQVCAELHRAALPAFHRSSRGLVKIIEDAGLKLRLSCWEVRGDVVNYFNYWDIGPDANRLTYVELILPDTPGFTQFAKLWITETKDIVIPINPIRRDTRAEDGQSLLEDGRQYTYLRVTHDIPYVTVSEFAARLEGSLVPFARDNGWFLGDTYWGLTGKAGHVVQMWIIPEDDSVFAAQRLATLPWQALTTRPPTYQLLEPTPSDPTIGSLHWRSRAPLLSMRTRAAG